MADNFINMDTDGVSALMRGFADTARDLDTGWQAVLSAIAGGESAFGGGAIGAAIASAYRPAGDALHQMAGQVPTSMMADADMGEQCAQDYRNADRRAAAKLYMAPGAGGSDARA